MTWTATWRPRQQTRRLWRHERRSRHLETRRSLRRLRTGHLRECETARRELRRGRPRRVDVVISVNTYKVSHRLHPPACISTAERTRRSKVWRRFRGNRPSPSLVSTRRLWTMVSRFPSTVRGEPRRVPPRRPRYPPVSTPWPPPARAPRGESRGRASRSGRLRSFPGRSPWLLVFRSPVVSGAVFCAR